MRKQARVFQYTIRGVSQELDQALRRKAASRHVSLNQLIIDELSRGAASPQKRSDLSEIAGKWIDDPEFDDVLAAQRQVDPDKWK